MFRHAAFLRGMNLGGRRLTNEELRGHVEELGFEDAEIFLASGNVALASGASRSPRQIEQALERGLAAALGYEVPTFVRSRAELLEIAAAAPLAREGWGKLQVALLREAPAAPARQAALAHAGPADLLAFGARELYWLPAGPMSSSELDLKAIGGVLGEMTIRTKNTIERMAARYFAPEQRRR